MHQQTTDNLDAMIQEEKKRVAMEFFGEAWSSALNEGIEASILAESALFTALTRLTEADGEHLVSLLIDDLPKRMESGHFLPNRSLQ